MSDGPLVPVRVGDLPRRLFHGPVAAAILGAVHASAVHAATARCRLRGGPRAGGQREIGHAS